MTFTDGTDIGGATPAAKLLRAVFVALVPGIGEGALGKKKKLVGAYCTLLLYCTVLYGTRKSVYHID